MTGSALTEAPPAVPDAPAARLLLPASASRAEWEEVRRSGIGGSDVAAILGLDRYKGPRHIYEAKHGREEEVTSEPAEIGIEIEEFIARLFTKRSGIAVRRTPGTLANIERSWMRANLDFYALAEGDSVIGPLECKNRSAWQADDWAEGPADAPAIQTHWYLATGGWNVGYVAALVGGNSLRWYAIERDEEMCEWLTDHCAKWFQRHVVDGVPPAPDGLEATTDLLAKLWSVRPETIAQVDLDKAHDLRARRAALKAQQKQLDADLRTVENEMKLMTGRHEIARVGSKEAWSWKGNGTFASAKFAKEEPELAAAFTHMAPALDMARLKEERPDIYDKYRARVLRVPESGV